MSTTPCAACKYLRRKCTKVCVFAPYFPSNKQEDYEAVHKAFGACHVSRILNEVHPSQRQDAMTSLVYEARTHLLDPVHGCSRHVYSLQGQLQDLEDQLRIARNELASYNYIVPPNEPSTYNNIAPMMNYQQNHHNPMLMMPAVSSYGAGQLTTQQLQEEAHRVEFERRAQVQKMHPNSSQPRRD